MNQSAPTSDQPTNRQPPLSDRATQPQRQDAHVLILGGGITGLNAAWQLQHSGVRYTLIEAAPRLGGMIQTATFDGFIAEGGTGNFYYTEAGTLEPGPATGPPG